MQFFDANNASALKEQRLLETVQIFDRRILAAAEGLSPTGQTVDLLAWAHQHLLATVIHLLQSARPKRRAKCMAGTGVGFSLNCIDVIHLLLSGAATVDQTLKSLAGESLSAEDRAKLAAVNGERLVNPTIVTFGRDVVARFRHQLTRVAKRTRPHSPTELDAIWQNADASLLVCALEWFHLTEHLDLPFPFPESPETAAILYAEAAKGYLSIAWTANGPVFQMVKEPPGYLPSRMGLPA